MFIVCLPHQGLLSVRVSVCVRLSLATRKYLDSSGYLGYRWGLDLPSALGAWCRGACLALECSRTMIGYVDLYSHELAFVLSCRVLGQQCHAGPMGHGGVSRVTCSMVTVKMPRKARELSKFKTSSRVFVKRCQASALCLVSVFP